MSDGRQLRLITVAVGNEKFVFDIMAVRQIIPYGGSTPVPKCPSFIEGIIVLRNEVVPVIDLRLRLFPQLPSPDRQQLILICRTDEGTIGFKVDEVLRIVTIGVDQILPPPPLIRGLQGDLFIGIVPYKEEVFLLLDVSTLLTQEERSSLSSPEFKAAVNAVREEAHSS